MRAFVASTVFVAALAQAVIFGQEPAQAGAAKPVEPAELVGWNYYWSAEVKAETRFGGPWLTGTGTISPVNTAAIIPGADGTVFSLTAVNVTKLFPIDLQEGKFVAVFLGRYNLVDLRDEDFFTGSGIERFLNIAQIGPLTVLRQVPLVTNAASVAYLRGGEPFMTFALIDPNVHSTNPGLSDLFADGVTLAYAYTDVSNVLKDNLDLLPFGGRLRVEHQVEVFYNLHLTPWFQLTGDLQILRPNRPVADTAIVPAVRLRFVF